MFGEEKGDMGTYLFLINTIVSGKKITDKNVKSSFEGRTTEEAKAYAKEKNRLDEINIENTVEILGEFEGTSEDNAYQEFKKWAYKVTYPILPKEAFIIYQIV